MGTGVRAGRGLGTGQVQCTCLCPWGCPWLEVGPHQADGTVAAAAAHVIAPAQKPSLPTSVPAPEKMVTSEALDGVPILVLANKQDVEVSLPAGRSPATRATGGLPQTPP